MSTFICGKKVTLFYDYDELRDRYLSGFSDECKIQWFNQRIEKVFLNPLKKIIAFDPKAINPLHEDKADFMIATFSVILNGIEALGSFLTKTNSNKDRFYSFVEQYMPDWKTIKCKLWKDFRNAMTHGFQIENGAIEYQETKTEKYWIETKNGFNWLVVDPKKFLDDLDKAIRRYFEDLSDSSKIDIRKTFLERFNEIYPNV